MFSQSTPKFLKLLLYSTISFAYLQAMDNTATDADVICTLVLHNEIEELKQLQPIAAINQFNCHGNPPLHYARDREDG